MHLVTVPLTQLPGVHMKPVATLQTNGPQLSKQLKRKLNNDHHLNDNNNNDDNNDNIESKGDWPAWGPLWRSHFEGMFQLSYSIVYWLWWYCYFPLFFPYFLFCSILLLLLHSAPSPTHNPPIFPYFIDCHCAYAPQLCWVDSCDLIAYMKHIWCMTHTDAIETHPTSMYSMILHCLGFICALYKLILDEGYVLTQCLNLIDMFHVCPASRLRPIHSVHQNISILTHFTPWTSSLSGFTSLPS